MFEEDLHGLSPGYSVSAIHFSMVLATACVGSVVSLRGFLSKGLLPSSLNNPDCCALTLCSKLISWISLQLLTSLAGLCAASLHFRYGVTFPTLAGLLRAPASGFHFATLVFSLWHDVLKLSCSYSWVCASVCASPHWSPLLLVIVLPWDSSRIQSTKHLRSFVLADMCSLSLPLSLSWLQYSRCTLADYVLWFSYACLLSSWYGVSY